LSREEAKLQTYARAVYEERLKRGVAREQARKDLPLSTYTEAYWKIDLWNLLHFLGLRMDQHAQEEIRRYAREIGHAIVSKWVPLTWEAFVDYHLNAVKLSPVETRLISAILRKDERSAIRIAQESGWLDRDATGQQLTPNGEREEFVDKASRFFGLDVASLWSNRTKRAKSVVRKAAN
jgi:thymidylate synthase (FAD)